MRTTDNDFLKPLFQEASNNVLDCFDKRIYLDSDSPREHPVAGNFGIMNCWSNKNRNALVFFDDFSRRLLRNVSRLEGVDIER